MKKALLSGFSAITLGFLGFACSANVETSVEAADVGSTEQAVCTNAGGVPAVMAALAAATAIELHRWNAPVDFSWNSTTGMLQLTAAGLARCGGTCRNVQALLDMQKPEAYLAVKFADGELLNSYSLRASLQDGFNRQVRCNAWQGEYTTNGCWVEAHDLWYNHMAPGTCAKDVFFWRNKAGTNVGLDHPERLNYQLYFAGYPGNQFLNFHQTSGDLIIDPTVGLTGADDTTSGSCIAACTQYNTTSLVGNCCSCNGVTKTFSRSPFSASMYLCK